jgi:large subunit ribosomal protein L15e
MWRFASLKTGPVLPADKNGGTKMGYLKYVKAAFNKPSAAVEAVQRERLLAMRKEDATVRLEHPTRIDRARALGFKAKPGILVVRQRVRRGGHVRPDIKGGRRPSRFHQTKNLHKNYQQIAEERANDAFHNCEVLGSYPVGQDGYSFWYEVIMVDRAHPQVLADKQLIGIAAQTGRAYRGVTSAGRKGRGLRKKGIGSEKTRPSRKAKGY